MRKRLVLAGILLATAVTVVLLLRSKTAQFPSDQTPEGAYARIALAMTEDRPRDLFAYLETEAQWASFTLKEQRAKACASISASYPEPERSRLLAAYLPIADAPDGPDVFVLLAKQRGWLARLRKDMSGLKSVEVQGERATVVTARGTRYPFHRRDNGIWGLTLFTAELLAESERATRDLAVVNSAAEDYKRAAPTPSR